MPHPHFEPSLAVLPEYAYIAGALAVGVTAFIMVLTRTTHPPAGATAILAATEPGCVRLGWLYIGVVAVATMVILAAACLLGNLVPGRRYPLYWWSPLELAKPSANEKDVEGAAESGDDMKVQDVKGICVSAKGIVIPQDMQLTEEEMDVLRILEARIRRTSGSELERVDTAGTYSSTSTLRNEDGIENGTEDK